MYVGYIILKSNEEIVARTPKLKISAIIYSVLFCLCDVSFFTFYTLVKVASSIMSPHGFRGARTTFSNSALMRHTVLYGITVSFLALSL